MTTLIRVALLIYSALTLAAGPSQATVFFQADGPLEADFDGDGQVAFSDFVLFASNFGRQTGDTVYDPIYDVDGDGSVDFGDFIRVAAAFGEHGVDPTPPATYLIYVLDAGTSSVDVYSLGSHLLQEYLPFRGPTSLVVSQNQDRVYVKESFGAFVLNAAHEVLFSVPFGTLGRMAVSPDDRFAYVSDLENDLVRKLDLTSQAVVDTVAVGEGPATMAITPDGSRLVVLSTLSISIVDVVHGIEEKRFDLGGRTSEVAITPDGSLAYYTLFDRAAVGVLDLNNNQIVGEIQLEGESASGIAFSPDGSRLYVNAQTSLVEVDPARNLVLRSMTIGEETSALAITPDGAWAYVGALEAGTFVSSIAVIDLNAWKLAGRIRGFTFPAEIDFRRNP